MQAVESDAAGKGFIELKKECEAMGSPKVNVAGLKDKQACLAELARLKRLSLATAPRAVVEAKVDSDAAAKADKAVQIKAKVAAAKASKAGEESAKAAKEAAVAKEAAEKALKVKTKIAEVAAAKATKEEAKAADEPKAKQQPAPVYAIPPPDARWPSPPAYAATPSYATTLGSGKALSNEWGAPVAKFDEKMGGSGLWSILTSAGTSGS